MEGIFRVAGQNVRCTKIREELNENGSVFDEFEDPHNVATVIKQWLRDLPFPVFLYENFDKLISFIRWFFFYLFIFIKILFMK